MKDMLVICRNCGDIARYPEEYITPSRKNYYSCGMCGNHAYDYKKTKKWLNSSIKKFNWQEGIELINEDKYNTKIFGVHKGFDYKKIDSTEPIEKWLKVTEG